MSDDYNCARCGLAFKWEQLIQTPMGNLFCVDCWQAFKNEPLRKCPVDNIDMKKEVVAEIIQVDRCTICGGIWFDKNELKVVQEQWKETGFREAASLGVLGFLGLRV